MSADIKALIAEARELGAEPYSAEYVATKARTLLPALADALEATQAGLDAAIEHQATLQAAWQADIDRLQPELTTECKFVDAYQKGTKRLKERIVRLRDERDHAQMEKYQMAAELAALREAEASGTLVRLPRKVGDTVKTMHGDAEVVCWDMTARVRLINEPNFEKRYRDYDIGSKIFAAESLPAAPAPEKGE